MADFAYTTVPGKLKPLLEKIRQVGIPSKVSIQWLKTLGFTSSNDTTLIGVLKFVGLVDSSNIPTSTWSQYRGAHHKRTLGDALQRGYAELFAVYPDAPQRANVELEHVFSTSSTAGKQVIGKTVTTFKALCEIAEFASLEEATSQQVHTGPMHTPVGTMATNSVQPRTSGGSIPSVHIDVQIHISPEASAEQIDQVFKSMAKHLYGAGGHE